MISSIITGTCGGPSDTMQRLTFVAPAPLALRLRAGEDLQMVYRTSLTTMHSSLAAFPVIEDYDWWLSSFFFHILWEIKQALALFAPAPVWLVRGDLLCLI